MSDHPPTTSSATGLRPNISGALAYLLLPVTGILFLVLEKDDRFVRFHAARAIVVGVVTIILSIILGVVSSILGFIPLLGGLIGFLVLTVYNFGVFLLWILLMYRAYQGQEWEIPVVSDYARKLASQRA